MRTVFMVFNASNRTYLRPAITADMRPLIENCYRDSAVIGNALRNNRSEHASTNHKNFCIFFHKDISEVTKHPLLVRRGYTKKKPHPGGTGQSFIIARERYMPNTLNTFAIHKNSILRQSLPSHPTYLQHTPTGG